MNVEGRQSSPWLPSGVGAPDVVAAVRDYVSGRAVSIAEVLAAHPGVDSAEFVRSLEVYFHGHPPGCVYHDISDADLSTANWPVSSLVETSHADSAAHPRDASTPDSVNSSPGFEIQKSDSHARPFEEAASREIGDSTAPVSAPLSAGGLVGQIVEDQYDVKQLVGKGGFGFVYRAWDRSFLRWVALKVELEDTPEAILFAKLDHENIVKVYSRHRVPGLRLFSMEYVAGGTLEHVVRKVCATPLEQRAGKLLIDSVARQLNENHPEIDSPEAHRARQSLAEHPWWRVVCQLGVSVSRALDHAHGRGIVHRDVKPPNILLTSTGQPKLTDFSVSVESRAEGGLQYGMGGTWPYLPAEQLQAIIRHDSGDRASAPINQSELASDVQVDLFGLAVVLWELLTGSHPFELPSKQVRLAGRRDYLQALLASRDKLPDPAQVAWPDGTPDQLKRVLLRCLQVDSSSRPASAMNLAIDLERCLCSEWQSYLAPPAGMWQRLVRRWFLGSAVAIALVPNFVLSVLNVIHDYYYLETVLRPIPASSVAEMLVDYLRAVIVGKVILYGAGLAVGVAAVMPIHRQLTGNRSAIPDVARIWAARLPTIVLVIVILAWLISGFFFPLVLTNLPPQIFLDILAAHVLCGLVAGLLAFYGLGEAVTRHWYPLLLLDSLSQAEDAESRTRAAAALDRLDWVSRQLVYAAWALAIIPVASLWRCDQNYRTAFFALASLGFLVLYVRIMLKPRMEAAIGLFRRITVPRAVDGLH